MAAPQNRIVGAFLSGTAKPEDSPAVSDGRVANRLRNRDKVIEAFNELVTEGKSASLEEVVERSGVARRSVFRYFDDLVDLAMEGFSRLVVEVSGDAALEEPGERTLEERIGEVVKVRLRTMGMTHMFGLYARQRLGRVEAVDTGLKVIKDILRAQYGQLFATELDAVSEADAQRLLDALVLAMSHESYDILVRQLERSLEEVRETWTGLVRSILGAA